MYICSRQICPTAARGLRSPLKGCGFCFCFPASQSCFARWPPALVGAGGVGTPTLLTGFSWKCGR